MDDAAGEAFDKGCPARSDSDIRADRRLTRRQKKSACHGFPRAKVSGSQYDFSFSGMKSAVLNYINQAEMKGRDDQCPRISVLRSERSGGCSCEPRDRCNKEFGYKKLAIAGGVASNSALRAGMKAACEKAGIEFYYPSTDLLYRQCGDDQRGRIL